MDAWGRLASWAALSLCLSLAADAAAVDRVPLAPVRWLATMGSATYTEAPLVSEAWRGVAAAPHGDVVVTGTFGDIAVLTGKATTLVSQGKQDVIVARYRNDGHLRWVRGFGSRYQDGGLATCADTAGNVFVAGYAASAVAFDAHVLPVQPIPSNRSEPAAAGFLAKLGPDGKTRWAVAAVRFVAGAIQPPQDLTDIPLPALVSACQTTSNGDVVVAGLFGGDPTTIVSVQPGETWRSSSAFDGFVARFEGKTGKLAWARRTTGRTPGADDRVQALALATDGSEDVLVGGRFSGTMTVGGTALSAQAQDGFVARLSPAGAWRWARAVGGPGNDEVRGLAAGGDVLAVGGTFEQTVVLDGMGAVGKGATDVFVARLDPDGSARWVTGVGGAGADEGGTVAVGADGTIAAGGAFTDRMALGGRLFASRGGLDALLVGLAPTGCIRWLVSPSGGQGADQIFQLTSRGQRFYAAGLLHATATVGKRNAGALIDDDGLLVALRGKQHACGD